MYTKNKKGFVRSYLCSLLPTLWEGYLPFKKKKSARVVIKTGQCTFFKEEKHAPLCISCGGFTNVTTYKHLVQSKSNDSICNLHYIRKQTIMHNICEQWKERKLFFPGICCLSPQFLNISFTIFLFLLLFHLLSLKKYF